MLERRRQRQRAAAAEEEEVEEEEAEAAPAPAATRPFVPITQVANKVLVNESNYRAFLAYTRPYQLGRFDERSAIMRKLGDLILKSGLTAQEAMQRMIDGNWTPVVYRRTR
jgi:hypothetical protein